MVTSTALVLNWKDVARTLLCVHSLRNDPAISAIIVVDNESDGSLRLALESTGDSETVQIVEQELNLGFAAGINVGLERFLASDATHVLVINNDARLIDEDAVRRLLRVEQSLATPCVVAPMMVNPDGSLQACGARLHKLSMRIDDRLNGGAPDFVTWACVLLSRSTLLRVGLLDDRYFMYWEDVDYGLRVRALGGVNAVARDVFVQHEISSSHARAGTVVLRYSALGLGLTARKYGGLMLVGGVVRLVFRCAKQVGRGRVALAVELGQAWRLGWTASEPAYKVFSSSASRS